MLKPPLMFCTVSTGGRSGCSGSATEMSLIEILVNGLDAQSSYVDFCAKQSGELFFRDVAQAVLHRGEPQGQV